MNRRFTFLVHGTFGILFYVSSAGYIYGTILHVSNTNIKVTVYVSKVQY
jgi:hypothetical protein